MDRNNGKIVDFEVSQSLSLSSYEKITFRLKDRFDIKYLCIYGNYIHGRIKISQYHVIGKPETKVLTRKLGASLQVSIVRPVVIQKRLIW